MISSLFHIVLYKPIFNIFILLYNIIPGHDVGIVILIVTVLLRLVLYPLTSSSIKAQRSLQELQPKVEAVKKQYADDKLRQAQAMQDLYKEHKINPFTSCLPMLVQLPILIALYWVLRDGLASSNIAANLYTFVHNPGTINATSLGLFNMATPSIVLAVLAAIAQFWQAKSLSRKSPPKNVGTGAKDEDMAAMMNKQMLYVMPVMTLLIGIRLPAGLTLYWFLSTLLMAIQQVILARQNPPVPPESKIIEGEIVK